MAGDNKKADSKEEQLKAALWYNVGKAVDAVAIDQNLNTTPYFIGGLSEMLWAQIGKLGHLECALSYADILRTGHSRSGKLRKACWPKRHQC